ncbi:MAG: cysteine hydrolase [Syntrophobacteraceae bacterium]|nr:cysteine hydrolase [Syntrophobacteraceae bacterium]
MTRKALLVIDVLNDFLDPKGALYCGDDSRRIIPVIRFLVDRFAVERHLIVFLRDAHAVDDREFELFAPHAVKGSWGGRIIPELTPPEGSLVVDKTRFSGFFGNNLEEILSAARPAEVWLAGVVTSICVMDTAGDLRNRDYSVVVPVDAVADFDRQFHQFALTRMQRVYGAKLVQAMEDDLLSHSHKIRRNLS